MFKEPIYTDIEYLEKHEAWCRFHVNAELEVLAQILQALRTHEGVISAMAPNSYSEREHSIEIVYNKYETHVKHIEKVIEGVLLGE